MKCPHCLTSFHDDSTKQRIGLDVLADWFVIFQRCPECKRVIIFLNANPRDEGTEKEFLVYPKGVSRSPLPEEVPSKFADDHKEACLVLSDSPKASAALSRRCLQHITREKEGINKKTLADEIDELIKRKSLPSGLSGSVDAIRQIGKFTAHPIKNTNTGEIVDVEPMEAEWSLNVLEALFDFYFVLPGRIDKDREAMNIKLKGAGKPPMN
ncbi:MAG: DUF4145 domain-containing protein [Candidatus Gygaella obscura]|nr:DUF4145 domain-containing protein [Candidatus Gygaella obscura]